MSQLKLNHEEVANRIKEAKKKKKTREKPKDNMTINYFPYKTSSRIRLSC